MAKALLMSGGVGGVSSENVTAKREHVLQGYTALTSDSDDEIVEGTIKSVDTSANNYRANKSVNYGIDNWSDATNPIFYVDFPGGNAYYNRPDGHPHVCIDADKLGNATADKVIAGSTFTSKNGVAVQGQIADRGSGGAVSYLQGREDWASKIWVLFKNGWYHREPYNDGQGHIHEAYVYVTYEQLRNLFGIDASKMLQGYGIAGVQGAIPKWTSPSHVVSAVNNEGFVWDDDTGANRGRGIISKIAKGRYIENADWVFLSSPNLYPQNIRAGVNINGITGTMPDYSTGRTVFNGATFDGTLLSGVANKDFHIGGDYYPLKLADGYGYTGIYGGGINLALSTSAPSIRGRQIGCVMSQSVNLAPFNRIAIYWKFNGTIKNGAYFDFNAFVALASNVQRGIFHYGSSPIDGFSTYRKEIFMFDQTQVSYIDVGDINEHAFLGFHAKADINNRDRDSLSGSLQVTRIDFLN